MLSINLPTDQVELVDFVNDIKVYCKRDELIHTIISGNKFRKLVGFIKYYYSNDFSEIVTVGSAHSNYIHAISYLCTQLKIPIKLFIYGNHEDRLTQVLKDLNDWNISWEKIERNKIHNLEENYKNTNSFFIPEGAKNELADIGMNQLLEELNSDQPTTGLLMACGTGASIQSILRNTSRLKLLSVSPVKNMKNTLQHDRLIWMNEYMTLPFAGYSDELMEFIHDFYGSYQILLDPIYTSKLLYEFLKNSNDLIGYEKIICIHSGGIQAWRDYRIRYPKLENKLGEILDFELQKFNIQRIF